MEWPRIDGHTPNGREVTFEAPPGFNHTDARLFFLATEVPHLCDVPDCPGPKLLARLEAAERLAYLAPAMEAALDALLLTGAPGFALRDQWREAIAAWEASEPVKEG